MRALSRSRIVITCGIFLTRTENFLGSAEVPEILFSHDARDEAESRRPQRVPSPLPAPPTSLADELEKEEERNSTGQLINGNHHAENGTKNGIPIPETRNGNQHGPGENVAELESRGQGVGGAEGEWFTEEDSLFEEMLGVDPLMRTEVDMLQKEKETWEADQRQLEREKKEFREQKEAFERCVGGSLYCRCPLNIFYVAPFSYQHPLTIFYVAPLTIFYVTPFSYLLPLI